MRHRQRKFRAGRRHDDHARFAFLFSDRCAIESIVEFLEPFADIPRRPSALVSKAASLRLHYGRDIRRSVLKAGRVWVNFAAKICMMSPVMAAGRQHVISHRPSA